MAQNILMTIDNSIWRVAVSQLERVESKTVEDFLSRTPSLDLVEISVEDNVFVAYPSRLLLEFLAECEELGLVD